jgi:hypothetical protein
LNIYLIVDYFFSTSVLDICGGLGQLFFSIGVYITFYLIVGNAGRVIRMMTISDVTTWSITYVHSIMLLESTVMLLENIYSTSVTTHYDQNIFSTGHLI